MSTPLNRELYELRMSIEHYESILKIDEKVKTGEMESDGRPLLTDEDIDKINQKLKLLQERRDDLLTKDKELS